MYCVHRHVYTRTSALDASYLFRTLAVSFFKHMHMYMCMHQVHAHVITLRPLPT